MSDNESRNAAKAQRGADARAAWSEYQEEKAILERKTAKLRAQRLAAEAEAAKRAAENKG